MHCSARGASRANVATGTAVNLEQGEDIMRWPLGLLIGTVLLAGAACATAPAVAPSVNVTGNWAGTWAYENPSVGTGDIRGTLNQDGNKVTGNFNITGPVVNRVAIVTGTIAGNEIRLTSPATGNLTVSGDEMTGAVNGLNVAKIKMRKQ